MSLQTPPRSRSVIAAGWSVYPSPVPMCRPTYRMFSATQWLSAATLSSSVVRPAVIPSASFLSSGVTSKQLAFSWTSWNHTDFAFQSAAVVRMSLGATSERATMPGSFSSGLNPRIVTVTTRRPSTRRSDTSATAS